LRSAIDLCHWCIASQAAARGQKAVDVTKADPSDPLKEKYGDMVMVQSASQSGRTWTNVEELGAAHKDQTVSGRMLSSN
jgi:hypothetical protein